VAESQDTEIGIAEGEPLFVSIRFRLSLTDVCHEALEARLERKEVQGTPPLDERPSLEERIDRLKERIGIDEQTTIILLEGASEQRRPGTPRKSRLN